MDQNPYFNTANHQENSPPPLRRIPRPHGLTNRCLLGDTEAILYEISKEFLLGNFPKPGTSLTQQAFQAKYKVPNKVLQEAITDLFTLNHNTLIKDPSQILSKALNIMANPQAKAARLTQYLEDKVYGATTVPGHLLIQNLIGSINLERQSSDSITKFVLQAMSSDIVIEAQNEGLLSVEEAIALISNRNLQMLPEPLDGGHRDTGVKDLSLLEEAIASDPAIPDVQANVEKELIFKKLPKVNSEYSKRKDTKKTKGIQPPTILPQ